MASSHSKKQTSSSSTQITDLKQRVLTSLDKLTDRDTYTQATRELDLTARSLSPSTTLAPFLTCLLSSLNNDQKPAAVAYSLRLISTLASTYGDSLSPHLPLILSSSIIPNLRRNSTSSLVRSACIEGVSSLSRHLLAAPFRLFLDPLLSAMCTDQDPTGPAMCLSAAVDSVERADIDFTGELRRAVPRMVKLAGSDGGCSKGKAAVLGVIGSVVAVSGVVVCEKGLLGSVVVCAVDSLGCEDWAVRKAAAEVLEKVAVVGMTAVVEDKEVRRLCVESLEKRRFDKVKNVREAMNRALKAWREVSTVLPLSKSTKFSTKNVGGASSSSPAVISRNHDQVQLKKLTKNKSSNCSTMIKPLTTPTPKFKRALSAKTRSSLSPVSTLSKTRSSLSTLSSEEKRLITTIPIKKKNKSLLSTSKINSDLKIEIVVRRGENYHDSNIENDLESEFISNEYANHGSNHSWSGSQVLLPDDDHEDSSSDYDYSHDINGEVVEEEIMHDVLDSEDHPALMIRKQLIKIEKQQSNLMDLVQRLMGSSQNGINALETRVSGLEKALDGVSYNLGLRNGRMRINNECDSSGRRISKSITNKDKSCDDPLERRRSHPIKDISEVSLNL